MSKLVSRVYITLVCLLMLNVNANAASVLISSITILSTKNAANSQVSEVKKLLFQEQEIECLATALYHEARGEPVIGQYAVGATIMNRLRSKVYPNKVCGVVFQNEHLINRCQFSFACDGKSDRPKNEKSFQKMKRLAKAIFHKSITREAKFIGHGFEVNANSMTHYHRYDVYPAWSNRLEKVSKLGDHVFFTSKRVTQRYTN